MHTNRRQLLGLGAALGASSLFSTAAQDATPIGKTKFALNAEIWFQGLPFLERFDAAARLGFPAVEMWPWRGKDLAAIRGKCDELGLELAQFTAWGFSPGMNDPRNHDAIMVELEAACAAAHQLGAKQATVIAGNDQPGMTQAEMHDNVITALKRAAPIAEAADVMLILEPMNIRVDHKGHCLYGSPDAVRICREVDSTHVKINWDLYHMQLSEGDLCGRLRDGFDQLGYVQLADTPGRNEPGTGEVSYNRVLRALHELGYRGYVGLECWPQDGDNERAAQRVRAADVW